MSRGLTTGVRILALAIAAVAVTAGRPAAPERPAATCASSHVDSACVRKLTGPESAALEAAVVVLERASRDECMALASFIRQNAGDARILPYPIRTPYGLATGDAHVVEAPHGTGRVHVADSVLTRHGALARPMSAKVRTLVHDFAHLALQLPQFSPYLATDAADDAIARCVKS